MKATIATEARYLFAKSEVSLVVCPETVFVKINADEHEEEVLQINRTSAKGDSATHLWQTLYNEARNYNKAALREARPPRRCALLAMCAALSDMAATVARTCEESELDDVEQWATYVELYL